MQSCRSFFSSQQSLEAITNITEFARAVSIFCSSRFSALEEVWRQWMRSLVQQHPATLIFLDSVNDFLYSIVLVFISVVVLFFSRCWFTRRTRSVLQESFSGSEEPSAKRENSPPTNVVDRTYVIWNGKCGDGQSNLVFHLSTSFAHQHPDTTVVVVDLCPQAVVSSCLLSSSEDIKRIGLERISRNCMLPKTVAGLFQSLLLPSGEIPDLGADEWLTHPQERNTSIPSNLHLLCGDRNLELMQTFLGQQLTDLSAPMHTQWLHTVQMLKSWIEKLRAAMVHSPLVCFVNCDAGFAACTQIAFVSGDRVIIPVEPEDCSLSSVTRAFEIVYGDSRADHQNPVFSAYSKWSFPRISKEKNLALPKIHAIVRNQDECHSRLWIQAERTLEKDFGKKKHFFTGLGSRFADFVVMLKDFHQVGISTMHAGKPLFVLQSGIFDSFDYEQIRAVQLQMDELCSKI